MRFFLKYEMVDLDPFYTWAPTESMVLTPYPTGRPATKRPTSRRPMWGPSVTPADLPTGTQSFHPDFDKGTCVTDGKQ